MACEMPGSQGELMATSLEEFSISTPAKSPADEIVPPRLANRVTNERSRNKFSAAAWILWDQVQAMP
jgi:hypothetical protein